MVSVGRRFHETQSVRTRGNRDFCSILISLFLLGYPQSVQAQEKAGTNKTGTVMIGDTGFDASAAFVTADDGSWTWSAGPGYDMSKELGDQNNCGTLELKDLTLSFAGTRAPTAGESHGAIQSAIFVPAGTIIKVSGKNTIENLARGDFTAGMAINGDVLFIGDGTLDVMDRQTALDTQSSTTIGILVFGAMVADGPDITAAGGVATEGKTTSAAQRSEGLYVGKDLVCGKGSVKASSGAAVLSGDSSSNGMSVFGASISAAPAP